MRKLPSWTKIPYSEIPEFDRLSDYVSHFAAIAPRSLAIADVNGALGTARYSYEQLEEQAIALQNVLSNNGVGKGDRVAVWSPPHTMAWISFLGTVRAGAVWLGLNPKYQSKELEYIIEDAAPEVIFAWRELDGVIFEELLNSAMGERAPRVIWLDDLDLSDRDASLPDASDPEQPCLLVYTSGTTGSPKGALLRQSGLVGCSRVQAHHYGARKARSLNALPINHVGSVCDTGTTLLVTGGAQLFMTHFDPAACNAAIESEQLTTLGGVPSMLQMMMSEESFDDVDKSSLQRILWSGAPMPEPSAEALAQLALPMHNFYGMTETTGSLTFTAPDATMEEVLETVGSTDPAYEVRIADPSTDEVCPLGVVGEIQAKSLGVLHSYLGKPEATKAAFSADGFFKTGDLGEFDAAGRIHLRGRSKEMFKSGGYNVYPAEVEAALQSLDMVSACVVVSVPDPMFHEVGYAFLVLEARTEFDPKEVKQSLSELLANYKIPKHFEAKDDFPLLPIGKVDRKSLQAMALDKLKG